MKRDFELIRRILLRMEEAKDYTLEASALADAEHDTRSVAQHLRLLDEAGLIDANLSIFENQGALKGTAERLTWEGHEFLDSIRPETIWQQTKHVIRSKGATLSFEAIKLAAPVVLKTILGQ